MYALPGLDEPLEQGDVFDDIPVYREEANGRLTTYRARAVVLTQTCDLMQNKAKRVVVGIVHLAEDVVRAGEFKAQAVRDQVRRGLIYGVYFLPEAPPPIELPESLVDLRDLHTIPRVTLESLVSSGKRVARLTTPYREHLAQHFAVTYMRVALPEPFATKP